MFQKVTDQFGDIPYFKAGKAYTGNVSAFRVAYDSQQLIYDSLLTDLTWAVNNINTSSSAVTAAGAVTVPGKALPVEAAFSAVGALSVDEAKVLHDIVRERVRLPEDMDWGEFRVGEDSTGEPAVWIVVVAHDDLKPSKSKIASLQRAREEVRSIVHSQTNRWPYIEIATQ